jgi:hypothetical protein
MSLSVSKRVLRVGVACAIGAAALAPHAVTGNAADSIVLGEIRSGIGMKEFTSRFGGFRCSPVSDSARMAGCLSTSEIYLGLRANRTTATFLDNRLIGLELRFDAPDRATAERLFARFMEHLEEKYHRPVFHSSARKGNSITESARWNHEKTSFLIATLLIPQREESDARVRPSVTIRLAAREVDQ